MKKTGTAKEIKKMAFEVIEGGGASDASHGFDQYEILFESAHDAMMVVNLKTREIESLNQAALELTGYLREEISGHKISQLFPQKSEVRTIRQGNPFSDLHLENSGFFEDVVITRKDGYPRFVGMSVKVTPIKGRAVAMCVLRDVTEKKNMERDLIAKHTELRDAYIELEKTNTELKATQQMLVEAGKLSALAELAAGIAHELNNPLQVIEGNAQMAGGMSVVKANPELSGFITEIISYSKKMAAIIKNMRKISRDSSGDMKESDLHAIINDSLQLFSKQLKNHSIEVETVFDPKVPMVVCDQIEMERACINFISNARDAIDEKKNSDGKITITTKLLSANVVELKIQDNGIGMPDATKSKIYNPFFTTKEVGKGTGLGLSMTYGILKKINASVVVDSTPGNGTTFTVTIPVDYRKQ